jgi:hypothetical protein
VLSALAVGGARWSSKERVRLTVSRHRTQPIAKSGFLFKQGGTVKSVKRRWFVLRGNLLSYYQTENDKDGPWRAALCGPHTLGHARLTDVRWCDATPTALGTIDLNKCSGLKLVDDERRGVRPNSFELVTAKRIYVISAETPEERNDWKMIIEDTIPEEPQMDDEEAVRGHPATVSLSLYVCVCVCLLVSWWAREEETCGH